MTDGPVEQEPAVDHVDVVDEEPQADQAEGAGSVGAQEHPERAATQLSVLPTPVPGATGVPAVDAALDRLGELADLDGDPEQQVAVFEDVHDRLQGALSGPDESAP